MFYIERLYQTQVFNFNKQTKTKLEKFVDHRLSVISGVFVFDIFAFEDYCKIKFDYKDEDSSFSDFCTKQFGQEVTDFINYLFKVNERRIKEK